MFTSPNSDLCQSVQKPFGPVVLANGEILGQIEMTGTSAGFPKYEGAATSFVAIAT